MAEEEKVDFDSFTLISTSDEGGGGVGGLVDKFQMGKEWLQKKQSGVHPWAEFFNVRSVSRPANVGDATSRLLSNLRIFYMNYLFVFMGLTIYCVVTNPILLFGVAFCVLAYWFISIKNKGNNITTLGREFSPAELYTALGVISVPVFYIVGAGSAIFWIIGASVVITLLHAIMMTPPSLKSGDEEMGIVMEDVTIS